MAAGRKHLATGNGTTISHHNRMPTPISLVTEIAIPSRPYPPLATITGNHTLDNNSATAGANNNTIVGSRIANTRTILGTITITTTTTPPTPCHTP